MASVNASNSCGVSNGTCTALAAAADCHCCPSAWQFPTVSSGCSQGLLADLRVLRVAAAFVNEQICACKCQTLPLTLLFDKFQNLGQRIDALLQTSPCTPFNEFFAQYMPIYSTLSTLLFDIFAGGCGFPDIDLVAGFLTFTTGEPQDADVLQALWAAAFPCEGVVKVEIFGPGFVMPILGAYGNFCILTATFVLGCICPGVDLGLGNLPAPQPALAGAAPVTDLSTVSEQEFTVRGSVPSMFLSFGTMELVSLSTNAPEYPVFESLMDAAIYSFTNAGNDFDTTLFQSGECMSGFYWTKDPPADTLFVNSNPFDNAWPSTNNMEFMLELMTDAWAIVSDYTNPLKTLQKLGSDGAWVNKAIAGFTKITATNATLLGYFSAMFNPGQDVSCQAPASLTMCRFLQQERQVMTGFQTLRAVVAQAVCTVLEAFAPGSPYFLSDYGAGPMTISEAYVVLQWSAQVDDLLFANGITYDATDSNYMTFSLYTVAALNLGRGLILNLQGLLEQPNTACACKGQRCCVGPVDDTTYLAIMTSIGILSKLDPDPVIGA